MVKDVPENVEFDEIEEDIFTNFDSGYALFSCTQIASRLGVPRGRVQRRVRKWRKRGYILKHPEETL